MIFPGILFITLHFLVLFTPCHCRLRNWKRWVSRTSPGRKCAPLNTLRPRQNDRHFPDDIFKWIFLNENVWISINISLKFVPRGLINNIPTLVQVMAWRRPGDKPLTEPMMVRLPTHICVTRPQQVKRRSSGMGEWNGWLNSARLVTWVH